MPQGHFYELLSFHGNLTQAVQPCMFICSKHLSELFKLRWPPMSKLHKPFILSVFFGKDLSCSILFFILFFPNGVMFATRQ